MSRNDSISGPSKKFVIVSKKRDTSGNVKSVERKKINGMSLAQVIDMVKTKGTDNNTPEEAISP